MLNLDRAIHDARLAQARAELAMLEARFKVRAIVKRSREITRLCAAQRATLRFGEPANDH